MSDLIKRDEVYDKLIYHTKKIFWRGSYVITQPRIANAILESPAVDAVEVVRCADCKHWGGIALGNVCRRWSAPLEGMKNCTKPDDFCSYGEIIEVME